MQTQSKERFLTSIQTPQTQTLPPATTNTVIDRPKFASVSSVCHFHEPTHAHSVCVNGQ